MAALTSVLKTSDFQPSQTQTLGQHIAALTSVFHRLSTVTDTDRGTKHRSAHIHALATFKHRFLFVCLFVVFIF